MIANDYLSSELAIQQEQQQLPAKWGQQQVQAKAEAARAQLPQHRPAYTSAKPPKAKQRKAARRQAKAGRKASR